MTPQELNEIRERLRACPECHGTGVIHVRVETAGYIGSYTEESCYPCRARIIQSWPALLAGVERLTIERDAYRRAKQENDDRFMRERDEARAEAARLHSEHWNAFGMRQIAAVERERDEARAEVERLRGQLGSKDTEIELMQIAIDDWANGRKGRRDAE